MGENKKLKKQMKTIQIINIHVGEARRKQVTKQDPERLDKTFS